MYVLFWGMTSPSAATATISEAGRWVEQERGRRRQRAGRRGARVDPGDRLGGVHRIGDAALAPRRPGRCRQVARSRRRRGSRRAGARPPRRQAASGANAARRACRIAPPGASTARTGPPRRPRRTPPPNSARSRSRPTPASTSNSSGSRAPRRSTAVRVEPQQHAMGRQDGQRSLDRLQDEHQDLRPGRRVLDHRPAPTLIAEAQRRLVPMVAVGERDRACAEALAHRLDRRVARLASPPARATGGGGRPSSSARSTAGCVAATLREATPARARSGPRRARRPGSCSRSSRGGAGSGPRARRRACARARECRSSARTARARRARRSRAASRSGPCPGTR